MFKALLRDRLLFSLLFLVVIGKLFSLNEIWVERWYSLGFYPIVSKLLRGLFGWMPFSVGDVLYILASVWLLTKVWKAISLWRKKRLKAHLSWTLFRKYLKIVLVVYLLFDLFWGLNYYRQGIEKQLDLKLERYSKEDLFSLTRQLHQRLNECAAKTDSVRRLQYGTNSFLFAKGVEAYEKVKGSYPFLSYSPTSVKASLFTPIGHWFGFTGYYNPFSAEAQLKTDIPIFLKPFVTTHEIAHQLGYAKENEASFVGYLACKASGNTELLYSAYFDVYRDAEFQCLLSGGKEVVDSLRKNLHPQVKADVQDLRLYNLNHKNFIEPLMSGAYDKYLKLNNQPNGHATYNEVVAYLIAYANKFGLAAI